MSSIKERIAKLSGGGGGGSKSSLASPSNAAKDQPEGQILWHGWLGKAGAGILSSTYNKRYMVLHITADGPWLSSYDSMSMDKLKGGRMSLKGATVSSADDKVNITGSGESSKPVSARFKCASPKDAAVWMLLVRNVIEGKPLAVTKTVSSKSLGVEDVTPQIATPTPTPAPVPAAPPAAPPSAGLLSTARTPPEAAVGAESGAAVGVVVLQPTSPVIGQLAALAALAVRIGATSGGLVRAPPPTQDAALLSASSTQPQVAKALEAVVAYLEQCVEAVAAQQLVPEAMDELLPEAKDVLLPAPRLLRECIPPLRWHAERGSEIIWEQLGPSPAQIEQWLAPFDRQDVATCTVDSHGNTLLHFAAYQWSADQDLVDVLVRAGADVHVQNRDGFDALDLALMRCRYRAIDKLLAAGAREDLGTRSRSDQLEKVRAQRNGCNGDHTKREFVQCGMREGLERCSACGVTLLSGIPC